MYDHNVNGDAEPPSPAGSDTPHDGAVSGNETSSPSAPAPPTAVSSPPQLQVDPAAENATAASTVAIPFANQNTTVAPTNSVTAGLQNGQQGEKPYERIISVPGYMAKRHRLAITGDASTLHNIVTRRATVNWVIGRTALRMLRMQDAHNARIQQSAADPAAPPAVANAFRRANNNTAVYIPPEYSSDDNTTDAPENVNNSQRCELNMANLTASLRNSTDTRCLVALFDHIDNWRMDVPLHASPDAPIDDDPDTRGNEDLAQANAGIAWSSEGEGGVRLPSTDK